MASTLYATDDLLICKACGTQYDVTVTDVKSHCEICDVSLPTLPLFQYFSELKRVAELCGQDPRQFVPPSGQAWTTLAELRKEGHRNLWKEDEVDARVLSIWTEKKVGIGQRAILLRTPSGNVLWDCITYLDQETVDKILSYGPLSAIIISHPHFYSTSTLWSQTLKAPLYLSSKDRGWHFGPVPSSSSLLSFSNDLGPSFLTKKHTEIIPGVTAIICGGHFDGSLCLHWEDKLFTADTLMVVSSAYNPPSNTFTSYEFPLSVASTYTPASPESLSLGHHTRTYTFMYSYPNMISLQTPAIQGIWAALESLEFESTFSGFNGLEIRSAAKERLRRDVEAAVKGHLLG